MKRHILTLFLLVFVLSASSVVAVSAAEEETQEVTTATIEEETTTVQETVKVAKKETIKVTKKVKVNKTLKLKKVLSLSKKKMKKYDFVSSKTAVATVNENGIVSATKKGKTVITVTSKKTGDVYAKITVKVKNRYNATQLRLMSSIIFCEAGAESYAGKKAVGIVIMNRIKSGSFPNTLAGVIYQRGQFTPAATGFLSRALNKYDNGNIPQACINAAKETLNGENSVVLGSSETSMANFLFFSRYVAGCRLKIGGHMFK